MKVGVLTASVSRSAGGLFWSVRALCEHLTRQGCSLEVFGLADEFSDVDVQAWGDIPVNVFRKVGPAAFGYSPELRRSVNSRHFDLIQTHGLWMYPSVVAQEWRKKWLRPQIVSPHGMLDPWALRNSSLKKRLASAFYEKRHLRGADCVRALCVPEYEAIRAYGLRNPVAVIPNGVVLPESDGSPPGSDASHTGGKTLLFLGRIHPKKGLSGLIRGWASARRSSPRVAEDWRLVIAGWDQVGHERDLRRIAEGLGVQTSITFAGPTFGEKKASALSNAAAFVLPSYSEGLPMAVLEAWAYGLPVLMTPACNLPLGFSASAALPIETDPASIAEGLRTLFSMSDADRTLMGRRGRNLVEKQFTWAHAAAQMKSVYGWLLGETARPECVIME